MKIAAVIIAAFLTACTHTPPKPAAARVSFDASGSLAFEQVDFAATPATANTSEESLTLPVPAGSTIAIFDATRVAPDSALIDRAASPAALRAIVTVSEATELRAARRAVSISGPKSFPPPVGPSPAQIAAENAAWLWRIGLFAGLALAAFGVWWKGGLIIAGGLSVAAASAFGWFVEENPWLLWIFGGGIGLAAFGFALWHLWLKNRQGMIAKNFLASASVATPS